MTEERYVRAARVRIVDGLDSILFVASDGAAREMRAESAGLARAILKFLAAAHTQEDLLAHIAEESGQTVDSLGVVREALELLVRWGVVISARESPVVAPRTGPSANIVVAASGAVAAVHVPQLVQALQQRGWNVRVALTRNARRFVSPLALEALTHRSVVRDLWPRRADQPVPHLELSDWADVLVVYPASATTLARIAAGDCSDIVSATAIAARGPVLLAPSMNPRMFHAPAVQRNVQTLRADGFRIVHPGRGAEVAEDPTRRVPIFGPAPVPEDMAALVGHVLVQEATRTRDRRALVPGEWDDLFRTQPPGSHVWVQLGGDEEMLALIPAIGSGPLRLLDIGTGTGETAIEAAARGMVVTATDQSPAALEHARSAAGAERVCWIVDDITRSTLRGTFDVALDRACLHALDARARSAYARSVASLVRAGGTLIVKAHDQPAPGLRGTFPMSAPDIEGVLAPWFHLAMSRESVIAGPAGATAHAIVCVLTRSDSR